MINALWTGLVMALLFLIPGGIGLALWGQTTSFNSGFCWGAVFASIFCAWVGPRIGRAGD